MINLDSKIIQALRAATRVVVFTGAGVSAESGIPTFRDKQTGLWEKFDAAELATPDAFERDPPLVWGWYEWRRALVRNAEPNAGHRAIAAIETHVPQFTLITQNVDDLHERAGSTGVVHLHGELSKPYCGRCRQPHSQTQGLPDYPRGGERINPPSCVSCGASKALRSVPLLRHVRVGPTSRLPRRHCHRRRSHDRSGKPQSDRPRHLRDGCHSRSVRHRAAAACV